MNAPYEQINNMARAACTMPPGYIKAMAVVDAHRPAKIIQAGATKTPNKTIDSDCLSGLYEAEFTTEFGVILNCFVAYEKGFDGSDDEEAFPATATLHYALCNGANVITMLTDDEIEAVEADALKSMLADKLDHEADVAADRYAEMEAA